MVQFYAHLLHWKSSLMKSTDYTLRNPVTAQPKANNYLYHVIRSQWDNMRNIRNT